MTPLKLSREDTSIPRRFNAPLKQGLRAAMFGALLILGACGTTATQQNPYGNVNGQNAQSRPEAPIETYNENELVGAISTHLGVNSESAASAIEKLFKDRGRPVGYITGEEGGGAIGVGLRYGKGTLWMKDGRTQRVFWQGPSVGFDVGAEASKVFTLVYNLEDPNYLYQRFPGVEGGAFFVAGMAINYQRANDIVLAPVRSGVGVRLGANVGYTSYTKRRKILPF